MCWQHAACFGITERTLPKTYVCFVCENPPGKQKYTNPFNYMYIYSWINWTISTAKLYEHKGLEYIVFYYM